MISNLKFSHSYFLDRGSYTLILKFKLGPLSFPIHIFLEEFRLSFSKLKFSRGLIYKEYKKISDLQLSRQMTPIFDPIRLLILKNYTEVGWERQDSQSDLIFLLMNWFQLTTNWVQDIDSWSKWLVVLTGKKIDMTC